jgi:hypothetical protein
MIQAISTRTARIAKMTVLPQRIIQCGGTPSSLSDLTEKWAQMET